MIYLITLLAALLLFLWQYLPKRKAVHAARASGLPEGMTPESHWLGGAVVRGNGRRKLNIKDFFVGFVAGDSMFHYGLRKGATFLAEPLNEASKAHLKQGDIVVINAPAAYSPMGYRLRRIEAIDGRRVRFAPDRKGQAHRTRVLEEITAKVKYIAA